MYNFLRGASHLHQQILCHRNHRNLLFLCHQFRENHSMKINNGAKCCLLFDNVANKKCILIHSREFRQNTSSTAATSDGKKEGTEKIDPQKLLSKFLSELPKNYKVTTANVNAINRNMAKFNKEHAKSGYKIEYADDQLETIFEFISDIKIDELYAKVLRNDKELSKFFSISAPLAIPGILSLIFMLYLIWKFRPRYKMRLEHAQILAQPPITFDQFLNEYLPSGEIDTIYHYPEQNLLVVLIHPNALIKGEPPFTSLGLHVQLDESFRKKPMALTQRIYDEERRIGVRDSIPIVTGQLNPSKLYKIVYYLGTFLLMIFVHEHWRRFILKLFFKRRFRIVSRNSNGRMYKKAKQN